MAKLSPRSRCQRLLAKGNEIQSQNVQMCADIEYLSSLPLRHSFQKPHVVPRIDPRAALHSALAAALAPLPPLAPAAASIGGKAARAAVLEAQEEQLTAQLAERKKRVEDSKENGMDISEITESGEVRREALKWKQTFESLQKKNDNNPLPVRKPLASSHFSNT